MCTSVRLGVTALMAAVLLAGAASTASARNLSVSEQGFRVSWENLEFIAAVTVRCRLTLEGSFHARSFAKIPRTLIGAISRAINGHPCTGGEAWVDNGTEVEPLGTAPNRLPWHLTYESFTGRLPDMEVVNLLLSRFSFVIRATVLGLTCEGRYGNLTDNIILNAVHEPGTGISSLTPRAGSNAANLVEQLANAVCMGTGTFTGRSGLVRILSTGSTITVTLI
jgi:hypothetical protein